MSTVADLMGLGMPGPLASRLGNTVTALTTTGTDSAHAAGITTHVTALTTAGSQTGAILPSGATLGQPYWVTNLTSTGAVIYPPSGCTFNTSASTSYSMAQYNTAIFIRLSTTVFAVQAGA